VGLPSDLLVFMAVEVVEEEVVEVYEEFPSRLSGLGVRVGVLWE